MHEASHYRVACVSTDPYLFDLTATTRTKVEQTLATVGAVLDVVQCHTGQDVLDVAAEADLVMYMVRPLLTRQVIEALPRCRGIVNLGIGYDAVDVSAATAMGIPVSNVVNWCMDEVAEHAMALILSTARRLALMARRVRTGEWPRSAATPIRRLRGRKLGVVGFGRLGRAVAERASSFGLALLAYDPYVRSETMAQYGAQKLELDDLLRQADVITVHAPLNKQTFHLLSTEQFALMKEGVLIVNTSRGPIIDEAALVEALRAGKVWGAGLDVMEREPLQSDSPLCKFDNVTLTPHIASYSAEARESLFEEGAEIAAQLLSGHWLPTIVNPEVRPKAEERWGAYT